MEKAKAVIKEIHLYPSELEMLIKTSIWILSWIGGILSIHDSSIKDGLASAYFIFALSLLMEFASKIKEKQLLASKVIHTIFCFLIVTVFLVSSAILFGVKVSDGCYSFLFNITAIIIFSMIVDCFILWVSKEEEVEVKSDLPDAFVQNQVKVFEQKLTNGNLGNIEKEENKDV